MHTDTDVLISGAGPTGLALALWLTKQGVAVRIVDRTQGPGTTSRAMAVQARTLELYGQVDLAAAVVEAGHRNPAINLWTSGKQRASLSFGSVGRHLTPYPFLLVYPQDKHEQLLVDRLKALGIEVERDTEFVAFDDRGSHIEARLRGADGREQRCRAWYLAGCDGASSPIRHQIGAGFPGGTYDKMFYVADVDATGPAANGEAQIALDHADFVAWLAYNDRGQGRLIGVVEGMPAEGGKALTFDDVGHRAIASVGLEVNKVNWFSTYHVHHRVTDHYRRGRAFLLGDAAHVHSPAGGQGMNTGIGDAVNLAWKLAAVLKRNAPDSLLDSYEAERRAFALKLVDTTDRMFTFVTADGSFADFVRTRIAPVLAPLAYRVEAVRETLFRVVSQTMVSYHDGPISEGKAGDVHGGDRLPWVEVAGVDNYDSLRALTWQVHVYGDVSEPLERWCALRDVPLHRYAWRDEYGHAGLARSAAYLLRPDTYVGCAEPSGLPDAFVKYGVRLGWGAEGNGRP